MKKPSLLVLLLALLLLAASPSAAQMPIPEMYAITIGGSCWLPDGETAPVLVQEEISTFYWTKPMTLVVRCGGWLPPYAVRPKETIKLSYDVTGTACQATLKQMTYVTANYAAIVSPSGWSTLTCRFDLSPIDP